METAIFDVRTGINTSVGDHRRNRDLAVALHRNYLLRKGVAVNKKRVKSPPRRVDADPKAASAQNRGIASVRRPATPISCVSDAGIFDKVRAILGNIGKVFQGNREKRRNPCNTGRKRSESPFSTNKNLPAPRGNVQRIIANWGGDGCRLGDIPPGKAGG